MNNNMLAECMSPSITLPGVKYKSANRQWITVTIPLMYLGNFVKVSKVKDKNDPIPKNIRNRFLDPKHKNDIKRYLTEEKEFIIPPITLVSDKPIAFTASSLFGVNEFITEEQMNSVSSISGLAHFPICQKFECLDGNHRVAAITEIAEENPTVLEGSCVVLNIVYETRLKKIRQDFVDINQNAKSTSASINTLFDSRDPISNIVIDILDKYDYIKEKIDIVSTSISKNSKDIYTISNIRNFIIELSGYSSQSKVSIQNFSNKLKADKSMELNVRLRTEKVFSLFRDNNIIKECINDDASILRLREESIITSGAGLLILGRVIGNIYKYERDEKVIDKCLFNIVNYNWSRSNKLLKDSVLTSKGTLSLTQSSLTDVTKKLCSIIIPSYNNNDTFIK